MNGWVKRVMIEGVINDIFISLWFFFILKNESIINVCNKILWLISINLYSPKITKEGTDHIQLQCTWILTHPATNSKILLLFYIFYFRLFYYTSRKAMHRQDRGASTGAGA